MRWTLSIAACSLGTAFVGLTLPAVLCPQLFRRGVRAFPRNEWAGWVLTAGSLLWVALLLFQTPMGRFEHLKPALYVVAPLSYLLIVTYLDELLAPRALGGLLLLVASPILDIARWHASPLRLVVTVTVYLMVIAGMILIMSPYRLRLTAEPLTRTPERSRLIGIVGLLWGASLIALGLLVY